MQQTHTEMFLQALKRPKERREAYFDEDGVLVVRVRSSSWWFEVYGKRGTQPRVDSEMAPVREVLDAMNLHRELMLWAGAQ